MKVDIEEIEKLIFECLADELLRELMKTGDFEDCRRFGAALLSSKIFERLDKLKLP
jgi:hypothetical protein